MLIVACTLQCPSKPKIQDAQIYAKMSVLVLAGWQKYANLHFLQDANLPVLTFFDFDQNLHLAFLVCWDTVLPTLASAALRLALREFSVS